MGFLKRIRSRSKIKNLGDHTYDYGSSAASYRQGYGVSDVGSKLPLPVLDRIFSFVCPHTRDESYLPSEDSMIEDGCMLCDMRDLAQASLVCSRWKESATKRLYVLYCTVSTRFPGGLSLELIGNLIVIEVLELTRSITVLKRLSSRRSENAGRFSSAMQTLKMRLSRGCSCSRAQFVKAIVWEFWCFS
jgi:hypothetical protein